MRPNFPYQLTGPIGAKTLGLIVLQTDETLEQDFRRIFAMPDVALHIARVPSGDTVTPDTLTEMRNHLPSAAALLPPAAQFGAVGYGCTSGSTLIGPETVAALVGGAVRTHMVSNPLSAALAALAALGIARVGIVSPYIASVAGPLADAFRAAGHQVPHTLSFGEEVEERVARIDPASIKAAALDLAATGDIDAVFVSCTNLRTLDVITEIEAETGLPALSSNQVLAWHMARGAGAYTAWAPGQLFSC